MRIRSILRLSFALGALLALPMVLSACDTTGDDELAAQLPPSTLQAPPRPEYEIIPFLNAPQAEIWRPGYWLLQNNQFTWVSGRVIARPSPTAVWSPARWVHHAYGWSLQQGHWE